MPTAHFDTLEVGPDVVDCSFGGGGSNNYYLRAGKNLDNFTGLVVTNFDPGISCRAIVSAFTDSDGTRGVDLVAYGVNNVTHTWSAGAAAVVAESNASGLYMATNGSKPIRFVPHGILCAEYGSNGHHSLLSENISQPTVNVAPANAYGSFSNISGDGGAGGGLNIVGLSAADERGLLLQGIMGSTNPTDTTPAVVIRGSKSDGAGGNTPMASSETVFAIQNGTTSYLTKIDGAGRVGINTGDDPIQSRLDVNGSISPHVDNYNNLGLPSLRWEYLFLGQNTPASSSASGSPGQIAVDANFIYVCSGANSWKRAALSSW